MDDGHVHEGAMPMKDSGEVLNIRFEVTELVTICSQLDCRHKQEGADPPTYTYIYTPSNYHLDLSCTCL